MEHKRKIDQPAWLGYLVTEEDNLRLVDRESSMFPVVRETESIIRRVMSLVPRRL